MSAHTPGPWEVCAPYVRTRFDINEGGGTCIAEIDTITAEHVANGHLIAAAPELLAMVRELDAWLAFRPDLTSREEHAKVKALIAKATGEQP